MEKPLKLATVMLTAVLAATLFISLAKSQPPPPMPTIPMTIDGYVLIRRVDGTNKTVPAGFAVYAKEGTTVINVEDPQRRWITDANGYFVLGASASSDGVPIDLWIEDTNVTRVTFRQGTFLTLNLTVIDTTSPTINIVSPRPNETLPPNQPIWINATLTDNFALNPATITLKLNETALTPTYNPKIKLLYYQTSPLTPGNYIIKLSVEDLAGNLGTRTWSFTITQEAPPPEPPTVSIISPTTTSPVYTQAERVIQVTYKYTEASPKNATIKIYNSTHTLAVKTITGLTGGTNVQRTDVVPVPAGAADGSYNLNVTIFNIHDLSATASQLNAVKVDNTKPVISNPYQDPPGRVVQPGETVDVEPGYDITVKVNVTEPNIEKVSLYYKVSATEWIEIQMAQTASGEYTATIPSGGLQPCTTIQYYVKAVDKAGNTAQTPTAGVYFISHIISEYQRITLAALLPAIALIIALTKKGRKNP